MMVAIDQSALQSLGNGGREEDAALVKVGYDGDKKLPLEVDGTSTLPPMVPPANSSIGVVSLAMIVFFNVSGGPFGIEESVRSAGFLFSILGFVLFPLIWSVPESLVTAELGSAYPEASGGVVWVEEAFGQLAGWQAGYLGWMAGATDNAIYPVLFLDYAIQMWSSADELNSVVRLILIGVVSVFLGFLNWLGLEIVGKMSLIIGILSMSPFVIMVLVGVFQLDPQRWLQTPSLSQSEEVESSTNLRVILGSIAWRPFLNNLFWNLNSFDAGACYAGEVENPGRTLPRAMFIAVCMVIAGYLFPLMVAIGATDSTPEDWEDGYLATAAGSIGGRWLEAWVILAAGIANISLYQAELSADAYQLMGMADRGFLPKIFSTRSRYGTPTYGIMLGVAVIIAMGNFDLERLIEMLNLNYSTSLLMEYAAFLKLRVSKPDVPRPYRIPFGMVGCTILLLVPTVATLAVICLSSARTLVFSLVVNLVGILIFYVRRMSKSFPCPRCCGYTRVDTSPQDLDNSTNAEEDSLPGLS
ncbi:amino acid permease [Nitzschia inconspicua]|uniref:Amino acid permease n=1 Tax=Nitzschia inconspicua TaxID=303405 RepID=A0A9K3L521_9STRA|nr:amino acid permease [Nitzschia inconspicua]